MLRIAGQTNDPMRTIWHSLAWKEWHEHKWKLVAITAVLWGVGALIWVAGRSAMRSRGSCVLVTMCMVPLAVFVGLGAAAK